MQAELENSQNDNRALRERQEQYETNRIHLEQRLPTDEGEPRVKALMAAFASERQVDFWFTRMCHVEETSFLFLSHTFTSANAMNS